MCNDRHFMSSFEDSGIILDDTGEEVSSLCGVEAQRSWQIATGT